MCSCKGTWVSFFPKICLKSKRNHWWWLKNGVNVLCSICKYSEGSQYRIPFLMRLFCEKTFDGKVGGDDRTFWIFHGLGSRTVMTCSSQLPGNMSVDQKKKIRPLACSSMKWLWIAMMCITAGWTSCQPGLDWCSEGHAVQGRCEISVGPSLLGGTEKTLWKAVLSGQIKTTVTFDVLRGWGNLSGLGSFSAFCCVIYYLGRKVWIIFLSFFFFFKC